MKVLVVKTSSLGDVIHTLPALTDARAARPALRFDWVVEQAFAEIPRWHPAVECVIACRLRHWRRHPLQAWRSGEWRRFREALRRDDYDLVLDAQGLFKSAWLARGARGPLAGPDRHSAREPIAAWFYDRKIAVPAHERAHAVTRMRLLFARALGYPEPDTAPDFGLSAHRFGKPELPQPYAVFLHATTWPTKCWPEESWKALGAWLRAHGICVVLPWGNAAEQASAQRIAAACGGIVPARMTLAELASVLAHASFAVGVDTGLSHLADALGLRAVTLYGPTLPHLTGTVSANQIHLRSSDSARIERARPNRVELARVQAALSPWLSAPAGPAAPRQTTAAPEPAAASAPPPAGRPPDR